MLWHEIKTMISVQWTTYNPWPHIYF